MYPLYKDIREGLGTPKWIDGNGVPRYCEFDPQIAAEIYADWVVLMEVKCQACGKRFRCADSYNHTDRWLRQKDYPNAMDIIDFLNPSPDFVIGQIASWGDAPWHDDEGNEAGFGSQCAGTTMCADSRVIELYRKAHFKWEVVPPSEYSESSRAFDEQG